MKSCYFYTIIDPTKVNPCMGGGNQTGQNVINNLKTAGFDTKIVTPKTEWLDPNEPDIIFMFDAWNDPQGSPWFSHKQYEQILASPKKLFVAECAYTGVTTAPYGMNDSYDNNLTNFTVPFFDRAEKVILASPLHLEEFKRWLRLPLNNHYLYLREVDTSIFYNTNQKTRTLEYITVGAMNFAKGTDIVKKEYANLFVVNLGSYNQIDLAKLYNLTKTFVHKPRWKESFSRTTCEAALCGCKLEVNNNVGALSWGLDLSSAEIYENSRQKFVNLLSSY